MILSGNEEVRLSKYFLARVGPKESRSIKIMKKYAAETVDR